MTDKRVLVCFVTALAAMGAVLSAHHAHAVYGDSSIALKNATVTGRTLVNAPSWRVL